MQANQHSVGPEALARIVLSAAVVASAGCTSPLTTVALREFLRESTMTLSVASDAEDVAAEASKPDDPAKPDDPTADGPESDALDADAELADRDGDDASVDGLPTEQRIERSLERLARTNGFDAVARDVLVDTLERATPEDWPAIIDSFAASLESSPPRPPEHGSAEPPATEASSRQPATRAGGLTVPVATTVPITEQPPVETESADASDPPVVPAVHEEPFAAETTREIQPEDPREVVAMLKERLAEARRNAPLVVRRACFASKVRGWGNLDAFDEPRFVPGQDVLVYVELDNLDGIDGPRGFATRVEARLRLLDDAGDVVEQWGFPTVEDRSDSPRTDYFVRYVVRIPIDATSGKHRLEAAITDAVSSKTVTTELPLEVDAGRSP